MRHRIALLAALALLAGPAALPSRAQDNPAPRTAHVTVERTGQGGGAARGLGCQKDSFGARVCADGTAFPGGPFGTRPARPAPAATTASARADPVSDPLLRVIHDDPAEAGNLYGAPEGGGGGTDPYGCRPDATGRLVCD